MSKYILSCLMAILILFVFSSTVLAQPLQNPESITGDGSNMEIFAESSGFNLGNGDGTGLSAIIATVIKAFLGLLAIIFIVLMIYAGFTWMTAGGDEQKVTTAKETIKKAIIGLVIIISAYTITAFVFKALPFGSSEGDAGGGVSGDSTLPPG